MRNSLLLIAAVALLSFPIRVVAQMANRTAQVIAFRIEHEPLPFDTQSLIEPLSLELVRIFRMEEIVPAADLKVRWGSENPFNKFKKLSKRELELVSVGSNDLMLKVEIEHRYNAVLGGLIKKSKRHVMRLKLALFAPDGQRVWYHKKKDSCCIDLGVDPEEEAGYYSMDPDEFMSLYRAVVKKSLAKF